VQGRGKGRYCTGPAEELVNCNPATGEMKPPGCRDIVIVVDCKLGSWSRWDHCSATCGTGQHERRRSVVHNAKGGGKPCTGALVEIRPCHLYECPHTPGIDCVWGDWDDWGDCTKCAGQRFRTRNVLTYNKPPGKPCLPGAARETRACPVRECHKPIYCTWGDWLEWGPCTGTCGPAHKKRKRELMVTTDKPLLQRLAEQNDELQQRIESDLNQRMQHLVVAFSAGAASLVVVLGVVRGIQTWTRSRQEAPRTSQSQAGQTSSQDMYQNVELEGIE